MFAVSASAEGGVTVATSYTAASELTDGYYVLKTRCKGKNGYIYHNPANSSRPFRQKLEANVPLTAVGMNMEYVWKLTKNATDGTFTLQNVGTAAYMPAYDDNGGNFAQSTAEANAAKYKFTTFTAYTNSLKGGVLLYETNFTNTRYVHCNETDEPNLSYWAGGEAKDDGSVVQFAFYKVENLDEAQIASYTINYKIGDNTVFSATNKGVKGETFSVAPTSEPTKISNYYLTKNALTGDLVLSDDNNVFNVVYSKGIVPFTFSTAESKTWYTLSLRNAKDKNSGAGNYLIRQDNNNIKTGNNDGLSKFDAANVTTFERFNGGVWAFVESGFGVKLMNKFTGTYVKVDGGDHKAYLDATGTVFYVQTTSAEGAGFSLQYDGKTYLGDHKGGNLGTWTPNVAWGEDAQNDGGSGFAIHDANLETYVTVGKTAATFSLQALTANEEVAGKLTINTAASIAAAKTAVESATATVDALNAAYAKSYNVDPTAYYRIKNVAANDNQNSYVSSQNIFVGTDGKLSTSYNAENGLDRVVRRVSADKNYASQLWQFVDNNNGTFKLKNANTDCCLGGYKSNGTALEMPIDDKYAGEYTLKATATTAFTGNDGKSMLQLVTEGHTMNAWAGASGETIANYDNHDGDNGNYWQFIKVTTVPVNISAANYATVAYPFAVKVPAESGVKAYAVSDVKNGVLVLSEITDGIIAANTGAILYHEGEKQVNLQITTDEATYTGENKLQGATAKRTGFTANDTYVLALNSANQAAFLKSELTTVPANKAYVLASALPAGEAGAQALNFGFGEVTGINDVNADSNNAVEYYDLNGRRVLYPANGIFVTNTGKKVFIK